MGDQLIRDPSVAVFEMVKNAYDADSPDATITMSYMDDPARGEIVVEDSGSGMDLATVTNVWLEPGTDNRLAQKEAKRATSKYKRVPVGEKGVGRFAAHKLGEKIQLITRQSGSREIVVDIDWDNDFKDKRYLEDVQIRVTQRAPLHFKGAKTGTRIEVTRLRDTWTKKMARDLARSISAISSPYQNTSDFKAKLVLKTHPEWLAGLLDVKDVLGYSLYKAKGIIKGSRLSYTYEFMPYPAMKRVKERSVKKTVTLGSAKNVIDLDAHNIGPVQITLYLFDLDSHVLKLGEVNDKKGLKEFLKESGGVRVYRGGIRVYDYGEPGNDWLNLGGRRVNIPTKRLSNNQILGAVALDPKRSIDLKKNRGLIEKTNREGFVENSDYDCFHDAIVAAITNIEVERNFDKKRIRDAYYEGSRREPVLADISELRQIVEDKHLTDEIGFYLDRIEDDFLAIKDRLLTSASAGLSLSVVIHEVEKGVAELVHAVESDKATHRIKALAKHLADLIEGYGALVRRSGSAKERASSLVSQALFNLELRLKIHKIEVLRPTEQQFDFQAKCSRRLVISTLMNLIDNSIWWMDNRWGDQADRKKLFISIIPDLEGHPGIVVADNGPGFIDPPELLVEPFISRKPDGMGLGLHVASEVMKAQGGALVFPERDEVSVPKDIDGAIVGLSFKESQ